MKELVGRWRTTEAGGLEFHFRDDGSFEMKHSADRAAGRYRVRTEVRPFEIDIHFVQHSSPARLGLVRGIFELEGDRLLIGVGALESERAMNPKEYVAYART